MSEQVAQKVFPPGRLLLEELDQRGWSQADFAHIIGRSPRVVNEIIKAKRSITPETALALSGALGTEPEFWMSMEAAYQLSKVRIPLEPIARRARMYERFPIREMQKRGWIPTTSNLERLESSILTFLVIDHIEGDLNQNHAAKRSSYVQEISPLQAVWLSRARQLSAHTKAADYSASKLGAAYSKLKTRLRSPEDVKVVPEILSASGIRLVIVEPIVGSRIDGACFWLSPSEPVVALSLRYDRHDMFWHALFHELDHIEHGEGTGRGHIDKDLFKSGETIPAEELRANNNAANHLIEKGQLDKFVAASQGSYTEERLLQFANRVGVHPGIVVGQLQHRDCLPWSAYNFLKSKIRPFLVQYAVTDGFGVVVR